MKTQKSKASVSFAVENIFHRTPVVLNWVSIFLIGYATYQPAVMQWVHDAPFGTLESKDLVMAWLDWICPSLGVLIQFARENKPQQ